ncbi:carbon starvation protein CstA [Caldicellulosiruptor kronotskyensis 2002]|uniref:Carbon starvation protein CstA n=1 Tax=Caldicellulosiruptor kronotskyensis (strain DSM 18902 / VKM B-2412 / 2002) TaxID=632348 RepID=E4SDA1_CALK2|nr:carbon starvation protein A [Caldicellulosiruptor kronotskyensis]ADQ45165.1 carbon starvation protein CstA [Caldicellulosiruptor kronotskyensis 2002]
MSALELIIAAALILVLAYRFYGSFLAAKVLVLDSSRETPAKRHYDGKDYVPMNKWIAFGHHFAAIAGAGPLVGPVLAAQFGYLPGTLWILIGAVLAGAVHDMVILLASVRHDGKSLFEIAKKEVGPVAGVATAIAIFFLIILTMAGLGLVVVNALFKNPWGVFTIGMTIPIAIFIGIYMHKLRPGRIAEASLIGVALILLAVLVGPYIKNSPLGSYLMLSDKTLEILLPLYGFLAAALPVWLLLAPRDYLSSYMKIGTILLLAIGIIIVNPRINMPAVTQFINGGGPIINGKVWPFICITIACGAISGFHALISSGTTPKLIANEKDIKLVGFGGMLTEAFVALMALIAATTLMPGDYFAINTKPEIFQKLNMQIVHLPQLSKLVGEELAGRPGGAVTLAVGMADIFSRIGGLRHLMAYWYQFAIMFEALFILTTIDAGTRVARYIAQDLLGMIYSPIKENKSVGLTVLLSAAVSFAWGYLIYGGDIKTIWPVFGVANQTIGALALAIGTTMILQRSKKKIYALTTFLPMTFLFITVLDAGITNVFNVYLPQKQMVPAVLVITLMILAIIIMVSSVIKWISILSKTRKAELALENE